jgi:hypothetical protein
MAGSATTVAGARGGSRDSRDLYLTGGTRVGVNEGEIVTLGVQI